MGNIILTDYCNQSCPYCFAKKMMDGDSKNISIEKYRFAVDYLLRNNQKLIGLIGGEPTLHPDFVDLVDYIIKNNGIIRLFTNGLIGDNNLINHLSNISKDKLHILVNLNDKNFYSKKQITYLNNVFENLNEKIVVGYNIYTETFSLEFHQQMINKFNLVKNIRLGLTSPNTGSDEKDFIKNNNISTIANSIMTNVDIVEQDDIMINLDCGFYMCMFTTEQLGILMQKTMGFNSLCNPIIDIDINLDAHRCFPLTGFAKVNLKEFDNFDDIIKHFDTRFEGFKIFGKNNQCISCKHLKRKQCRGECFARILNNNNDLIHKLL
ncbi:MAG: radical SAM protein [Desulfobacterales bacterium]|nr:radical SAM protein [Desulfobacterales bacterium]